MRTRTLATIGAGLAILVLGATLASAAGPDTPYDTLRIEAFDAQEGGRFADRMASAGDLDGDGVPDVWISAYDLDVAAPNTGRVYAMSGRTRQPIYRIDHPEPQPCMGFACGLGWSISNLEDIDGDGISDLVAAANRQNVDANGNSCTPGPENPGCNRSQGKAYVFSGADGEYLYDLNNPQPQANGYFGWASKAGDITGDGISEVLVGAFQNDFPAGCGEEDTIPPGCRKDQGQSFIFNGATGDQLPEPRGTLDVPVEDRYLGPDGRCISPPPGPGNPFTQQVCGGAGIVNEGVGDVDGDGVWDQSVTAWTTGINPATEQACWYEEPGCNERQGRIYIYSGSTGDLLRKIDDPVPQEGALFGLQIVQAGAPGDINNDGFDDVYGIGFMQTGPDRDNQAGKSREGRAWVFSGQAVASGAPSDPFDNPMLSLIDPTPEDFGVFGYSLEKTDYNRDGIPDLYIGSFDGSYVFLSDGTLQKVFDLPPEDEADQPPGNTNLGRSVAAPGDLNGDCEPDFLSGSPGHDVRFVNDGRLYGYLSSGPSACPAAVPPPPVPPAPPVVGPCGDPTAAGYLHPAKLRVSRARVLREDRRL
ncbi:MAG: VCBS repeat-containing protein, partial [Actinomycetota bacterium]|nr:VCBS repeat-containing protein [Actinomycetota bacterium]